MCFVCMFVCRILLLLVVGFIAIIVSFEKTIMMFADEDVCDVRRTGLVWVWSQEQLRTLTSLSTTESD